jgi:hypothetical protein
MTLSERIDIEVARHGVEAVPQRFRDRHAVRAAILQLGVALLAR